VKKNKDKRIFLENHPMKTRRDFLAQGFTAGLTYTLAPSIISSLYSRQALAQATGCTEVNPNMGGKTPVIIFDLAGGANIAGSSVIVGGAGGQADFIQDYTTLGLPPDMHPSMPGQTNNELGLMFHSDSPFLRGIQAQSSMATRANTDGGIFCTSSSDDTANNPHNPCYWLNKAGATGGLTPLAGTRNTDSGGRSTVPPMSFDPSLQPVILNRPSDALGLVNVGKLGTLFPDDKVQKILKAVERMSEAKIMSFANQSLPMQIKELVKCGYVGTNELISKYTSDALDPSLDPMVMQAFDNLNDGDQRKTATIAKLVLDGHIGAGTIEDGGYDYHNGTRATGEVRDFGAGELIGRVLELARLKNTPVMIYVYTDGSVTARAEVDNSNNGRGKFNWTGDSGQRSSSMMLVYNPVGRATLRTGRRQIGHFKESGSVENSAMVTSNSVINLAKAVVGNYMALHGEEANISNVVGDNPFGSNLDQYLLFNKIV
jgi:hypothetical protein